MQFLQVYSPHKSVMYISFVNNDMTHFKMYYFNKDKGIIFSALGE